VWDLSSTFSKRFAPKGDTAGSRSMAGHPRDQF
jgi:hypothetical protein